VLPQYRSEVNYPTSALFTGYSIRLTGKIHPCRDNRGFAGVRQARRMERKATSIFALGSILLFLFFARRSFSGLEKYF